MPLSAKKKLIATIFGGPNSQIAIPNSAEHSRLVAREAMLAGEVVVACGGDGLQNIVAQQAVETGGTMSVLPLGRGNDFAASLQINNVEDTFLALKNNIIHEARYVLVDFSNQSKITLTCAGVGLLSEAAFRATKIPFFKGRLLYSIASLACFINLKCHEYLLDKDGKKTCEKSLIIAAAASEYTGGGIFIAPFARKEPNNLNVLAAGAVNRRTAISLLNKAILGKHLSHPKVTNEYFSECKIDSETTNFWSRLVYGDGEFLGELPVKLSLGTPPLRVLVPKNL